MLVAAHDEVEVIADKVANVLASDYPADLLELIVASDGSTDGTVEAARRAGATLVLDLPRIGKLSALNQAEQAAVGEQLVQKLRGQRRVQPLLERRAGKIVVCSTMSSPAVRRAELADVEGIGRLLHDFNTEFEEPTPGPGQLADRVRQLLAEDEITVLVAGAGPDGLAVMRFRPAIWSQALEAYLAELYVVPDRRGQGLGRALMEAAIELARERGADYMDLGTGGDDVAARALYESLGFDNRGGKPGGPVNYFYEREL